MTFQGEMTDLTVEKTYNLKNITYTYHNKTPEIIQVTR